MRKVWNRLNAFDRLRDTTPNLKNLRIKRKSDLEYHHPDFDIVNPGEENVFIVGFGGRSGKVCTDKSEYTKMKDDGNGGTYIYAPSKEIVEKLKSIEDDLIEIGEQYARMKHCYQHDVIRVYESKFGRRCLLTDEKSPHKE